MQRFGRARLWRRRDMRAHTCCDHADLTHITTLPDRRCARSLVQRAQRCESRIQCSNKTLQSYVDSGLNGSCPSVFPAGACFIVCFHANGWATARIANTHACTRTHIIGPCARPRTSARTSSTFASLLHRQRYSTCARFQCCRP